MHALQSLLEHIVESNQIRSYSGRSMYGKTCLAIVGWDVGPLMAEVIRLASSSDVEEIAEGIASFKTDSMGRGIVIYFPSVPYMELEQDDSEESGREPPERAEYEDEFQDPL